MHSPQGCNNVLVTDANLIVGYLGDNSEGIRLAQEKLDAVLKGMRVSTVGCRRGANVDFMTNLYSVCRR